MTRWLAIVLMFAVTVAAAIAVTARLRLDPNVASLLPSRGESAHLRRYVRGFGGADLAVVMVEGKDPAESDAAADDIAAELSKRATVLQAAHRVDVSRTLEPMLAFRHADAAARERLAGVLTPEGMRERLDETRTMLLAPGSGSMKEIVAADPLRLAQLVFEGGNAGAGVRTQADGTFSTDDGLMHLVLVKPKGAALRGDDAKAFVRDAEEVMADVRSRHPSVTLGLTGGHAIAAATEAMLTRDLTLSSTLATILASAAFLLVFRRARALVAVMPPLVLGTLWTAGIAIVFPRGLSGIAVAFMSVVVGVGVDTGVHVYAALLEARRDGLAPAHAARVARQRTARAVLVAASTAAAAFGALALSDIEAVQQLGVLCAAGEILTAAAILIVTPEIGAWLEKKPPPPEAPSHWTSVVAWMTATRPKAAIVGAIALLPIAAVAVFGPPPLAEAFVAVRPNSLEPLQVQKKVYEAFGGKSGQWVVLCANAELDEARACSDRIADRLVTMPDDLESVDALGALAPAPATQRDRYDARDALDMPAKADELEAALRDTNFRPSRFRGALDAMRAAPRTELAIEDLKGGAAGILLTRYLGEDEGEHLVALYVRPTEASGAGDRVAAAIREIEPDAMITGYSRLESALRESLSRDLPRIGLVAGALVFIALAASLRRLRDVVIALLVVVAEVSAVLLLVRVLRIPLHAYDALVLPVLLGITVDEAMFLLHRARVSQGDVIAETLRAEGPPVAATALTTSAGFGALAICQFDGLAHLGMVGSIGSFLGLVTALVVVPAGLRLWPSRPAQAA